MCSLTIGRLHAYQESQKPIKYLIHRSSASYRTPLIHVRNFLSDQIANLYGDDSLDDDNDGKDDDPNYTKDEEEAKGGRKLFYEASSRGEKMRELRDAKSVEIRQ